MPERQLGVRVEEQPGAQRLVHHLPERHDRGTDHCGQFRHGEPGRQYRGCPQHLPGLAGQQVQPAQHRPGQRPGQVRTFDDGRGTPDHAQPALRGERADQLADVPRIAARGGDQLQQPRGRWYPDQPLHQRGDLGLRQRTECQRLGDQRVERGQQGTQCLVARHRPVRGDDDQGEPVDRAAQPAERHQAGRVDPVQVVDDQQHRSARGPRFDPVEDRLGDDELGLVAGRIHPQAPGDRRERRLPLLAGSPPDAYPRPRGPVGHRVEQRCLADARLALDQHHRAAPGRRIAYPLQEPLQLGTPAGNGSRHPASSARVGTAHPGGFSYEWCMASRAMSTRD